MLLLLLSSLTVYKLLFFFLHVDFNPLSPCALLPGRGTQDEEKDERSVLPFVCSPKIGKNSQTRRKSKDQSRQIGEKGLSLVSVFIIMAKSEVDRGLTKKGYCDILFGD